MGPVNFELTPATVASTVLLALTVFGALRFFVKRKKADGELVNWSPLEALAITVGIYFMTQLLVGVGVGIYASSSGLTEEQLASQLDGSALGQFLFILGIEILTLAALVIFLRRRKTPWSAIGWIKPRWKDLGYAIAGFGVYFVTYAFIVASLVENYLPVDTEQRQELGFDTSTVGPELVLIFMSLVIIPPLVEEIVVRGFLFTGLRNKLSIWPAAIVTSIVFGAAHLQWGSNAPLLWTAAIDTFMLSMILVYLRHKTGSLWPGIGVHFIKNGIAFLALFIFKVT